jgi:hypothetical protein
VEGEGDLVVSLLRGWRYVLATNHALWQLEIEPTTVPKELHQLSQRFGYDCGFSPQEMAALISHFMRKHLPHSEKRSRTVVEWVRKGRVRNDTVQRFREAAGLTESEDHEE